MATSVPEPIAIPTSAAARAECVVDAVSGHGHHAALLAETGHHLTLAIGQHLGLDAVDAESAGDRLGGDPVVTGQHDHLDARRSELGQGFWCALLDLVGDSDEADDLLISGHEHSRRSIGTKRVRLACDGGGADAVTLQEARAADKDPVAFHGARDSLSRGSVEVRHGG
jgi:hypothetical protein